MIKNNCLYILWLYSLLLNAIELVQALSAKTKQWVSHTHTRLSTIFDGIAKAFPESSSGWSSTSGPPEASPTLGVGSTGIWVGLCTNSLLVAGGRTRQVDIIEATPLNF